MAKKIIKQSKSKKKSLVKKQIKSFKKSDLKIKSKVISTTKKRKLNSIKKNSQLNKNKPSSIKSIFVIFIIISLIGLAKFVMTDTSKINMPVVLVGIIWAVIFIQIAESILLIWETKHENMHKIINLFAINGIFSLGWSFYFYIAHSMFAAFIIWIAYWLSTYMLIGKTYKVDKKIAKALVGYLIWLTFVGIVNIFYI